MSDYEYLISAADLVPHIEHPEWVIVDCRFALARPGQGRADYLQGHIPGASYADLDRDLAAPVSETSGRHPLPDAAVCAATFARLGIGNDSQVVAYDGAGGALAARLWWMLRWLGHRRVALLDGGLDAWREAGGTLEAGEAQPEARQFHATPDDSLWIDTARLQEALAAEQLPVLVDARERARFLGQTEPIDAVAGHIPGARNLPFAASLDSRGRWRERGELRRLWSEFFPDGAPENWFVSCGSGVTACHLGISAQLAGLAAPGLYVGSWSEWIRDPARPVASGE